jgi:hypothetical protein
MAKVFLITNVFDSNSCQEFSHSGPFVDFLLEKWPDGFGGQPFTILLNGKILAVEDYDVELGAADYITLLTAPRTPAFLVATFAISEATAVVVSGVLLNIALALAAAVITAALAPKAKSDRGIRKSVYSINQQQNQPALGDPVPEHFGKMWFYPSYASQPYVRFLNGEQYLYQIMLLSAGSVELNGLRIGTTNADSFDPGTVEYHLVPPSVHGGVLGNIKSLYGVDEDVVSSVEVQSIEFQRASPNSFFGAAYSDASQYRGKEKNPNFRVGDVVTALGESPSMANHNEATTITAIIGSYVSVSVLQNDGGNPWYQLTKDDDGWRGWFEAAPPLKRTTRIEVDITFPNGIYTTDDEGDFRRWDAYLILELEAIDDQGVPLGLPVIRTQYIYSAASANPKRHTESVSVPEGRYRARMKRDDRDDARMKEQSKCWWVGLRAFCVHPAGTQAYGDVSLLVMTIKATRAVSEASTSQIVAQATRILPTVLSDFSTQVATTSVVDAFAHAFRSSSNVPDGLDMPNLKQLAVDWAGTNGFNYRFEDQQSVYDALQTISGSHRATPTAYARLLGMRPDRAQEFDKFLITQEQMGFDTYSLGVKLGNDTSVDSYRVGYTDPQSPNQLSVIYPLDGAVPEELVLNGCTDKATATAYAQYLWTKRDGLRRVVEFETEFDANSYVIGDRIAILHPLMDWISTARVLEVNGRALMLDGRPDNQGVCQLKLRDEYGRPSPILSGTIAEDILTLTEDPPFPIYGVLDGLENTSVVLGTSTRFKRSYVVTEISPSGTSISVKAIGYDGAEYAYPIPGEVVP